MPPHPHAGFSALTYVFEDSEGRARSRDSLGNDVVVDPGGIVWFQAGSGAIHHEVPAEAARELRGAQIFIKLSVKNQRLARVVRGPERYRASTAVKHNGVPGRDRLLASPCTDLDAAAADIDERAMAVSQVEVDRAHQCDMSRSSGSAGTSGDATSSNEPTATRTRSPLSFRHSGTSFRSSQNVRGAHFLVLSGAEIREPVVVDGPFIMNDRSQIDAAAARYRAGEMGALGPLLDD